MECLNVKYLSKQDICVPCGHCAFCMATRRSDWALRLHYESRLHLDACFVTLTYADAHLVWKTGTSQLHKPHLQQFFKRVRRAGYKLRYYAVGEYGSRTYRPHYHILLFGQVSEQVVRRCWEYGQVHIGRVTQASVMYTLGYMVNGKHWTMRKGRVRPFCTMSRRPGIGANYLTPAMIAWHKSDRKNYTILDGAKRHLPRYYKEKIFSKIDRVRIAVRAQKDAFKREVEWIRTPSIARMADPFGYRDLQRQRLAQSIRDKTKSNQLI